MKHAINIVLEEAEAIELRRILIDEDREGALAFLKTHLQSKILELLEGG